MELFPGARMLLLRYIEIGRLILGFLSSSSSFFFFFLIFGFTFGNWIIFTLLRRQVHDGFLFSLLRPELIKLYSSHAFLTFLLHALYTSSDTSSDFSILSLIFEHSSSKKKSVSHMFNLLFITLFFFFFFF